MDAKLWFWCAAVVNFVALTGFAVSGVRQIKRGEVARHRRSMLVAASLVLLFVVSYVFKVAVLGRENMAVWAMRDVWMLRFHELCVLAMLVGGVVSLVLGARIKNTRRFTFDMGDPAANAQDMSRHRVAGRIAVVGAVLGVISAAFVWLGMLARAGS